MALGAKGFGFLTGIYRNIGIGKPITLDALLDTGIVFYGGAVVGFFYGIYKAKEESDAETAKRNAANSEEARKQRVKWAGEVKQKALNVNNTCSGNKTADKPLVSTTYKANTQMTEIMNELTRVAEKQGKVDSLAEELSKKGGASL